MQGLTDEVPKPMLEVEGRPMLAHILDNLQAAGLSEFLIVTGYRAGQIEEYFAGRPGVVFRRQEVRDGTARAALAAREFASGAPFVLTYADILTGPEVYRQMAARVEGVEAVLAVKQVGDPWQGAAVYMEGDRVIRIVEKPPQGTSTTPWNSAGIYCFRESIFGRLAEVGLSPRGEYELTGAIAALLDSGAPAGWYAIPGWWRDVGRPEDLAVKIPAAGSSE